jgi:hypothetical protein
MGCCKVPEIQPEDIIEKAPRIQVLQVRRFESILRCWLVHRALAKHPCALLFLTGAARVSTACYQHLFPPHITNFQTDPQNYEDGIHFHIIFALPLPSAVCCGSEALGHLCPRSPFVAGPHEVAILLDFIVSTQRGCEMTYLTTNKRRELTPLPCWRTPFQRLACLTGDQFGRVFFDMYRTSRRSMADLPHFNLNSR